MSRKKAHAAPNHERWLVSYADFVTMMFALFVVLFSSAQANQKRRAEMSSAMQNAFTQLGVFSPASRTPALDTKAGGDAARVDSSIVHRNAPAPDESARIALEHPELAAMKKVFETRLHKEIARQTVAIRLTREGLVISLREVGFFESGSASPRPDSETSIALIAAELKKAQNSIRIEGHTDDIPIHNGQFASNWELSTARASILARILIERYRYNPEQLSAAGFAEFHPIASNSEEQGRAQNRRVDLVVLPLSASEQARTAPRLQ